MYKVIGKYIYGEWLVPIVDYYKVLKKKEFNYEIVIPFIISIFIMIIYSWNGLALKALVKLRDILPNTLAILIGFTIACITILISTNTGKLEKIDLEGRAIGNKPVQVYQWLLIMLIYALIVEIFSLLLVFFTAFLIPIVSKKIIVNILLVINVYLTLHVLLIILRSISNIYFVFFNRT